ncbi:MAG TPA: hypothetical protein ENN05_11395 [Deltaproteobacteria bacterium]|nr:hypothetical protein [Deltaproteobacteria bacterium]
MKIDPNMIIGAVVPKAPEAKSGSISSGFEDMLRDVQKADTKEASPVQAMPQINNVNPLKVEVLTMSEQAIDMLGTYSKALLDPGNTLKTIGTMVNDLDVMRSKLDDAGSFLADDDPLKEIVGDVTTTLLGEIMRYRRGDLIG